MRRQGSFALLRCFTLPLVTRSLLAVLPLDPGDFVFRVGWMCRRHFIVLQYIWAPGGVDVQKALAIINVADGSPSEMSGLKV